MRKFFTILLILLLASCTSNDNSEETSNNGSQTKEIVFEQGFGKNPSEYVSNWNKLVSEISSDEETLFFFSINPDNVQWASTDRNILFYQFYIFFCWPCSGCQIPPLFNIMRWIYLFYCLNTYRKK